jgi:hypothetical protein
MFRANMIAAVITATLFGFFVNAEMVNSETEDVGSKLGASQVAQVEFDEGQSALKANDADEIKAAVAEAKKAGNVTEVKILSWADQEYPAKGTKAPKASVSLADERANKIKDMVKKDLGVKDVDVYNMAKRPNAVQDILKTSTAKVKAEMETSGAAPTKSEDTGLFGLKGKKSAAVVLVYTK